MKLLMIIMIFKVMLLTAHEGHEAALSLYRLQQYTRQGVNYSEYIQLLDKTRSSVTRYYEKTEAGRKDRFFPLLQRVIDHYNYAAMVWSYKYAESEPRNYIPEDTQLAQEIIRNYSAVIRHSSRGEVIDWVPGTETAGLKVEPLVSVIFIAASEDLAELKKQMYREFDESLILHQWSGYHGNERM